MELCQQSDPTLRHRGRDPYYHGVRGRRAKRVVNKTGDQNIGFINIPNRSLRFLQDFVTTLVRVFFFVEKH